MDVTVAVLADCANMSSDGKLNIMGIFAEINPPVLPFHLPSMYLVLGFSASPAEVGSDKRLRVVLLDPDGRQPVLQLESIMTVGKPIRSGSRTYLQSVIGLNGVLFARSGDYLFSVLVNGEEKTSLPLYVNEPANPINEGGDTETDAG
jgi:hypothetical protein